MNIEYILELVSGDLAHVIADEQAAHPGVEGEALVTAVVGDLKHYLRGRVGVVVDLVWASEIQNALAAAVREAIAIESNLGAATS